MWQKCGPLNDSVQIEERLRAQVAYQGYHVVEVWASESSFRIEKRLRAQTTYQIPQMATMRTMESEEKCGQRLSS
jgi:hypothetical protein